VAVTFDPGANLLVTPRLEAYFNALMKNAHSQLGVNSVNISSTTNHPTNKDHSRHTLGLAFDINYINGTHVTSNESSIISGIELDFFYEVLNTDQQLGEQYLEFYSPVNAQRWYEDTGNTYEPTQQANHNNPPHIHISLQ